MELTPIHDQDVFQKIIFHAVRATAFGLIVGPEDAAVMVHEHEFRGRAFVIVHRKRKRSFSNRRAQSRVGDSALPRRRLDHGLAVSSAIRPTGREQCEYMKRKWLQHDCSREMLEWWNFAASVCFNVTQTRPLGFAR